MKDAVVFLGQQKDVSSILRSSDIFVLFSWWEGMAMALLEAMAHGLPVITSDAPGVYEVMNQGEFGFVASPQDPALLAKHIEQLTHHTELRKSMGQEALRVVRGYHDLEKISQRYVSMLKQLSLEPKKPLRVRPNINDETLLPILKLKQLIFKFKEMPGITEDLRAEVQSLATNGYVNHYRFLGREQWPLELEQLFDQYCEMTYQNKDEKNYFSHLNMIK